METTSFLAGGFNDPGQSSEAYSLRTFKGQIEDIRDLLDFGTSLPQIKARDIEEWDNELRGILREIKRLKYTSNIDSLLESTDAVRKWIEKALDHFYVASDILQKKGVNTIREREKFYEKLRASSQCLTKALEYFLV